MKKNGLLAAVVAVIGLSSCGNCQTTNVSLKTDVDSASYAIGVANGAGFRENLKTIPGGEANIDALLAGFIQAIKGDSTKMSQEEAQAYLQTYFVQASEKEANKSKEEGEAFLAENRTKEGVITTESGLQYKVETEGTGEKPTAEATVKVHYHGTLLDGTVFDSSIERGEPTELSLNQVIRGWTEGLQIMPVGSKYTFWVPADLGYGTNVRPGGPIKANDLLKFEIELLEIVK
jgi:FKBP-type peptidyl-prolyl cis-trans isomerases 1